MFELLLVIIIVLFIAWLAFVAGYIYRGYVIVNTVAEVLKEVEQKNQNLVERLNSTDVSVVEQAIHDAAKNLNITMLKYEQAGDQYYFYTKDTDHFVCQGRTLEEACENYYAKEKSKIGCVADPTLTNDSFFIVKGKIQHRLNDL